ncbi:CDP-glucose 4,6-dehydratase [Paraconexibacter antarcticus]|uniref:CDP-glucose 4,6-dehydratase n=1 Tax=Paraconexibacter antarcticus TaxID=2949664 RepID=A0ABY5DSP9_9ACTN|nr:CDP-glucose 4,6-dehydratase [Paraconexibacter antarcticus]UTI65043.1 CDP-glucose 4,6-dehydratase [Paraconexibacter antarcticus]
MSEPVDSPSRPGVVDPAFWRGRRVLLTGHTGFKGAWLTLWLQELGAEVTGFSRGIPTEPSLYALARVADGLAGDVEGDIRDAAAVLAAVDAAAPDIVIHMAAQPMVRRSFAEPRETYETNVMGTVNVLDAVRVAGAGTVRAVVNVTSDKCYDNAEGREQRPFVEDDPKGGHDPYSNSKGCAELVADAYRRSFFSGPAGVRLASVRAGNVIGGGDWGEDRLVPDILRGAAAGSVIPIRRPDAVRPWQHVLNPLSGYLVVAQALCSDDPPVRDVAAGGWNFGPAADDVRPVGWLVSRLTELWPGDPPRWEIDPGPHPHEAGYLALDSGKARSQLGWSPAWDLEQTLAAIVAWHAGVRDGADPRAFTLAQIRAFAISCPPAAGG